MSNRPIAIIYVVRHGETEYNVQGLLQGQTDSPLTENGRQQALERAEALKDVEFDAIFSSDLERAIKTSEIIKLNRQLAINTSKLLREKDFGPYDGKASDFFRQDNKHLFEELKKLPEQGKKDFKFFEGFESDSEMADRMIAFLREVAQTFLNKKVLVVTHRGNLRVLLLHLGFGSFDELEPKGISNSAFVKLESDGMDFVIKEVEGIVKAKI